MNETDKKDNSIEIGEETQPASSKGGKHEKKPDKKAFRRSAFRWVLDIAIAVVIAFLITLANCPISAIRAAIMMNFMYAAGLFQAYVSLGAAWSSPPNGSK